MTDMTWTATEFTLTTARGSVTVRRQSEDRWNWRVYIGRANADGAARDLPSAQEMALKVLEVLK